jgi:hypothetical protein
MKCWKCGHEMADPPYGKVPFREECDKCGSSLHCCVNCAFYKPGQPNDCLVPNTDFIADRQKGNFCEEFKLKSQHEAKDTPQKDPKEAFRRLFGE